MAHNNRDSYEELHEEGYEGLYYSDIYFEGEPFDEMMLEDPEDAPELDLIDPLEASTTRQARKF